RLHAVRIAAGGCMRGQRFDNAVAPPLALAVARTLAPVRRREARNLVSLRPVPGATRGAEQVTGEGGATPPYGRLPRPGCAQRVRPVGSLPLRPPASGMSAPRPAPITKRASSG